MKPLFSLVILLCPFLCHAEDIRGDFYDEHGRNTGSFRGTVRENSSASMLDMLHCAEEIQKRQARSTNYNPYADLAESGLKGFENGINQAKNDRYMDAQIELLKLEIEKRKQENKQTQPVSIEERLIQLKSIRDNNLITEEDYTRMKKELLDKL
jgi:hypothetical protein